MIARSNNIATEAIDTRDRAVSMALHAGVTLTAIATTLKMPEWSVQALADRADRSGPAEEIR